MSSSTTGKYHTSIESTLLIIILVMRAALMQDSCIANKISDVQNHERLVAEVHRKKVAY